MKELEHVIFSFVSIVSQLIATLNFKYKRMSNNYIQSIKWVGFQNMLQRTSHSTIIFPASNPSVWGWGVGGKKTSTILTWDRFLKSYPDFLMAQKKIQYRKTISLKLTKSYFNYHFVFIKPSSKWDILFKAPHPPPILRNRPQGLEQETKQFPKTGPQSWIEWCTLCFLLPTSFKSPTPPSQILENHIKDHWMFISTYLSQASFSKLQKQNMSFKQVTIRQFAPTDSHIRYKRPIWKSLAWPWVL